jgi:hypothetical protein
MSCDRCRSAMVRSMIGPDWCGIPPVRQVSIDDTWSALRFRAGRRIALARRREAGDGGCGGHGPFEMTNLRV